MAEDSNIYVTLDARGLLCPLPVLKLRKKISETKGNQLIQLWADDPAAKIDVPHFCAETGHQLLEIVEKDYFTIFTIKIR